ncbi:MAG: Secretion system C-terminal sorting domain, partial [Bacteroidota bacterium]
AYYYIDDVCVSTDSLLCNDDFDSTTIDDVILFPNPASEKITIESKQRISKDKLLFFDVLGKNATSNVVIQQAYDGHRLFIDVRNLASAMYVLRLIDAENNLHLLKFIKQ